MDYCVTIASMADEEDDSWRGVFGAPAAAHPLDVTGDPRETTGEAAAGYGETARETTVAPGYPATVEPDDWGAPMYLSPVAAPPPPPPAPPGVEVLVVDPLPTVHKEPPKPAAAPRAPRLHPTITSAYRGVR